MSFKKKVFQSPSAETIKKARSEAGLTQEKAAELIHVSVRAWQKWEQGERQMPVPNFELFILKSGLDPNLIFWLP